VVTGITKDFGQSLRSLPPRQTGRSPAPVSARTDGALPQGVSV